MSQTVKRLPTMPTVWETRVQSLGQEDLLEKEMATHSSILAWKISWMVEPGRLQSMGSQRVGHDWATSLSLVIIYSHYISFNLAKVIFKNTILTCWTHQEGCYGKFPTFWFCASVSLCCRLSGSSTLFISCKLELISNGWCAWVLSCFSCVQLFVTLWPVAQQAPLPMGFSRQEYWNGLPGSPPGDLPNPGMEPPPSPSCFFCIAGRYFTHWATWEAPVDRSR